MCLIGHRLLNIYGGKNLDLTKTQRMKKEKVYNITNLFSEISIILVFKFDRDIWKKIKLRNNLRHEKHKTTS